MFALIGGELSGRRRGKPLMRFLVLAAIAGILSGLAATCPAQTSTEFDAEQPAGQPAARDFAQLEPYWNTLGGEDVSAADAAVKTLSASPAETLDWLEHQFSLELSVTTEAIEELIHQLDDDRFAVRESAQRQLSSVRWLAEERLREALAGGPSGESRDRIRSILSEAPGPFARTPDQRRTVRLARLLNDLDSPRAQELLKAIGGGANMQIVDRRLLPLYDGLVSPQPEVRAASALGVIELREAALPALPRLIGLLADDQGQPVAAPNGDRRRLVADHLAKVLPEMGAVVVEPLIDVLASHQHPPARLRAALVLAAIQDQRAMEPLLAALSDPDLIVATGALAGLQLFGAEAVEPLITVLEGHDPVPGRPVEGATRYRIAGALAQIGDARAIQPVARLLVHDDPQAHRQAVNALREFGDEAAEPLVAILQSNHPNLRNDARRRADILRLIDTPNSKDAIELMIQAAGDPDESVRSAALSNLIELRFSSRFGDDFYPRIWTLVVAALDDPSPSVRSRAAGLIGRAASMRTLYPIDLSEVSRPLLNMLDEEDVSVRLTAVGALGEWRIPEAFERMLPLLESDDVRLVMGAAEALGNLGDPRAIEPLLPLLESDDDRLVSQTAEALGSLGDPRAIEPLRQLLIKQTRNGDAFPSSVSRVISALGVLEDREAVELLISLLGKGNSRIECLHGITLDP